MNTTNLNTTLLLDQQQITNLILQAKILPDIKEYQANLYKFIL